MRGGDKKDKVVILNNVLTGPHNANEMNRTFIPGWVVDLPDPDKRRPVVASFFDLFEDGKPDVLISSVDLATSKQFKVSATLNIQMFDACFLKVMVASGLCFEDCSNGRSEPSLDPNSSYQNVAYGTNQPGPNVCYELVDTQGYKRHACSGQLSQSANFALQMPYAIFGLGSTPNFVDILTATIPSPGSDKKRTQSWTQIVPDAQVVLIPHPPDQPHLWRMKLFLTPSDIVLSTLITLAVICIVLILLIAILHRREILEDIAEHEEYKRHWPDSR
jgi:integrin alpha FG-GAP repeat containing protein 1